MKLDKETLVYLALAAVENYESEVAFRQGLLTHSIHRKVRIRWWFNPYRNVSYVDVLEWVEQMAFPPQLRCWHPKLYKQAVHAMYYANILDDYHPYIKMKNFLCGSKSDEYDVPNKFYNWLIDRQ